MSDLVKKCDPMTYELASKIIAFSAKGYTSRRISELFEPDPEIEGMQFSGEELITEALSVLCISPDVLDFVQTQFINDITQIHKTLELKIIKDLGLHEEAFKIS